MYGIMQELICIDGCHICRQFVKLEFVYVNHDVREMVVTT